MINFISSLLYKNFLRKFRYVGSNLIVVNYRDSYFSFNSIEMGENVFINRNAWFSGDILIGNNVLFGPNVSIIGGDHLFGIKGYSVRFLKPNNNENLKKVVIEDEVWVGANCSINKGVTLGIGSVIGSGSVVLKNIPPFTVAVGNPCKPIKKIFSDIDLAQHLTLLGYSEEYGLNVVNTRNLLLNKCNLTNIEVYINL